jgi:hypothetical protein
MADLELEVLDHHDFVAAIAVNVVDLKRGVCGQKCVARVGAAQMPEHFAVEVHCGHATNLDEVVSDSGNVLGNQHLRNAVAIEVAEPDITPGPDLRRVERFPELGPRVISAELGQPCLSMGDLFGDPFLDLIRRGHTEIPKPCRDVGGDADFAADELAVVSRQDEFPIDISLDGGIPSSQPRFAKSFPLWR